MSTTKNRPGTAEGSTEAISSLTDDRTDVRSEDQPSNEPGTKAKPPLEPPISVNQVYAEEVELFFATNQAPLTPMQVENHLINAINSRFLTINDVHGLKGARAYRPIRTLPPFVVARCILERDLPRTGLLGETRGSAALVTYRANGLDEGLYVPAEDLVWGAMKGYNASALERDFKEVLIEIRGRVPLLEPSEDENLVALANGLFDLETKELRPFSPKIVLSSKAAVRWNPDATTSPVIDGWDVDSWITELAAADKEIETLLWEVVAGLFRPGHAFDKAVLLISEQGANGKGTFLALLRNLVGSKRAVNLSMAEFGREFLPEKLANAFCVLSDENDVGSFMRSLSAFKAWVTHDWISLNRKGKDFIDIKGRGLCVFCMNDLPKSQDRSDSLYRRFIAVPFEGDFNGEAKNPLIKGDYIKREDVLEYVAHRALMMPTFDAFTIPDASNKLLSEIRESNDPIVQFAHQFLDALKWDLVPWDFLYALYRAWMLHDVPSGRAINKRDFTKHLRSHVENAPQCGWVVTKNAVRTHNKILGEEPLAVEYDLTNWFDMRPVNGSIRKIGIPHNMPVTARGLLRMGASLAAEDVNDLLYERGLSETMNTTQEGNQNHVERDQ